MTPGVQQTNATSALAPAPSNLAGQGIIAAARTLLGRPIADVKKKAI